MMRRLLGLALFVGLILLAAWLEPPKPAGADSTTRLAGIVTWFGDIEPRGSIMWCHPAGTRFGDPGTFDARDSTIAAGPHDGGRLSVWPCGTVLRITLTERPEIPEYFSHLGGPPGWNPRNIWGWEMYWTAPSVVVVIRDGCRRCGENAADGLLHVDLSMAAFARLGQLPQGVLMVSIEVVGRVAHAP